MIGSNLVARSVPACPALVASIVLFPGLIRAQDPIRYEISFPNAAHHEAEVTAIFADLGPGPLEVRMSRTSPGRYALHEFAKNVYDVRITGLGGRTVRVSRPDNHQWNVAEHGGFVSVSYTLFGDRADGTYTGIDRTHAHLNMPATFMWARGLEERPIELVVRVPEGSGWRVATQLAGTEDPHRFEAPDLKYFLDSPTEVSDYWEQSWNVDGQTVRVALHHRGTETEAERYAESTRAIVRSARDLFGELPDFEFGRYTFLACYLPWVSGDGMEHRNSTVLTSTGSLAANMTGLLGTVAHEFLHAWNVERIRPSTLEPFDFEAANMSGELWFAEGFTSYYDDVLLWRSGLIGDPEFAARMGSIANSVMNAVGRRFSSPVEMSTQAPFVDAAVSVDPTNRHNTFLSYYTWGAGVALGLDLTLRTRFSGLSLDDLMREMWRRHGQNEISYEVRDIESALAAVTGNEPFAEDFFERFVRGREAPAYADLLREAGIELASARPGAAWVGPLNMEFGDWGAVVTSGTLLGTPLYEAGLDRADRLLTIGGVVPATRAVVEDVLARHAPGDMITLEYQSRGRVYERRVQLAEDPMRVGRLAASAEGPNGVRAAWKQGPGR